MRFSRLILSLLAPAALLFAAGCATTPVTGRTQLMLTSESSETQMGLEAWNELLATEQTTTEAAYYAPLQRVATAIIKVAGKPEFQWDFRVIKKDDTANAFCLPGGKIAVYTGLYPFAANDAELAVVVAHEIGHAIARHGGEQISREMLLLGSQALLGTVTGSNTIAQVYGLAGDATVRLPFSRSNEYEADHIGLLLMAKAGYDPAAALTFWQKFGAGGTTSKIGEWLSTHPNSANRIEEMKKLLPEAQQAYARAAARYGLGQSIRVKQ